MDTLWQEPIPIDGCKIIQLRKAKWGKGYSLWIGECRVHYCEISKEAVIKYALKLEGEITKRLNIPTPLFSQEHYLEAVKKTLVENPNVKLFNLGVMVSFSMRYLDVTPNNWSQAAREMRNHIMNWYDVIVDINEEDIEFSRVTVK